MYQGITSRALTVYSRYVKQFTSSLILNTDLLSKTFIKNYNHLINDMVSQWVFFTGKYKNYHVLINTRMVSKILLNTIVFGD